MKNISINKEAIQLRAGLKYFIIDALYVDHIRRNQSLIDKKDFIDSIKKEVFPYSDNPFLEFIAWSGEFRVERIKKVEYNQIIETATIAVDSGVILFIHDRIFLDFAFKFDYGELVEDYRHTINLEYWESITNSYDLIEIAVIVSPGIRQGVDFDGSGTYKIT